MGNWCPERLTDPNGLDALVSSLDKSKYAERSIQRPGAERTLSEDTGREVSDSQPTLFSPSVVPVNRTFDFAAR